MALPQAVDPKHKLKFNRFSIAAKTVSVINTHITEKSAREATATGLLAILKDGTGTFPDTIPPADPAAITLLMELGVIKKNRFKAALYECCADEETREDLLSLQMVDGGFLSGTTH